MSTPAITDLRIKVAELQQQLLTNHPQMPVLLRTIHTQLRADPEIVTLFTDEEIGVIVAGLKVQTNTQISVGLVKKAGATRSLKKLDIDDL